MNQALLEWLRKSEAKVPEDDAGWTLNEPELSLVIWKAMEATDWRHLPYPGNLLDQPEWLIQDLYTLAWRKAVLRESLKSPVQGKPVLGRRM